jgi:transposase InsO family protein
MSMTATASLARAHDGTVSDDELAKPKRRIFSASYKLAILDQYEALGDPGAKGAFLRREGLYSSHIVERRRARDVGALAELAPKVRRSQRTSDRKALERAPRKIARLEDQLDRHRKALQVQGKATELLAKLLAESQDDEQPSKP